MARFEQKYQSPEVLPSFHNFLVLSNNMKAVQVPNEERRFFMLEAIRKHYTQADWSAMWALVKDPSFQHLFYQYLLPLDTNIIHKGQAPMTAFKTRVQARQAPEAIKFMKGLLDEPALMKKRMTDLSDSEHMAIRDEFESKGRFLIKSRPNVESPAFANLAEEAEWERFQLGKDLQKNSPVKELVPIRHVIQCIMQHFRGESYVRITADDVNTSLEGLGLTKHHNLRIPTGASSKRCYAFPSVQGLRYLLKSHNWLTAEDEVVEEED